MSSEVDMDESTLRAAFIHTRSYAQVLDEYAAETRGMLASEKDPAVIDHLTRVAEGCEEARDEAHGRLAEMMSKHRCFVAQWMRTLTLSNVWPSLRVSCRPRSKSV